MVTRHTKSICLVIGQSIYLVSRQSIIFLNSSHHSRQVEVKFPGLLLINFTMTVDAPTYFACTLGEAQSLNQKANPGTVNELIDERANSYPDQTFVGSPVRHSKGSEWQIESLTYAQLRNVSIHLAGVFDRQLGKEAKCVGLISESSLELLVTLFACIRLGIPVLMIA